MTTDEINALILQCDEDRRKYEAQSAEQRAKDALMNSAVQIIMAQHNYMIMSMFYAALNPNLSKVK